MTGDDLTISLSISAYQYADLLRGFQVLWASLRFAWSTLERSAACAAHWLEIHRIHWIARVARVARVADRHVGLAGLGGDDDA